VTATAAAIRAALVGDGDEARAGAPGAQGRASDPVEALGTPAWFDPFRPEGSR